MKLFCQGCGRMFKGRRGTLLCDSCKLEEYNQKRSISKSKQKLKQKNKMENEETVDTPEEEVTEEETAEEEVVEEETV